MNTTDTAPILAQLFSELTGGVVSGGYMLNGGDHGLLGALDRLSAAEASKSANGGATIAAHTQHVRFGLSLMNQWAAEGGDPFTNATWDQAWKIASVTDAMWADIRRGLRDESDRWLRALSVPREVSRVELAGMISSIAHLAYHLGAIRQIDKETRGPKENSNAWPNPKDS